MTATSVYANIMRVSPLGVQPSRLRVDARKWAAARLAPRKYGERVEHDVKGGGFQPAVLIQIGEGAPESR